METATKLETLETLLSFGNFKSMGVGMNHLDLVKEFSDMDFHFSKNPKNQIVILTKEGVYLESLLAVVDTFWSALGNIPVDEDGCLEQSYLHFEIGTDREYIWGWFEEFFDISVGKRYF